MNSILSVSGLTKRYPDFLLDHVSFEVPKGSIVGLIGENGAGKSTTLNGILGLIRPDEGSCRFFGGQAPVAAQKERIGVAFDSSGIPEALNCRQVGRIFRDIYQTWDSARFDALMKRFSLPESKRIKTFSRGMKMKLALAIALSHDSRLLVLDEATSGLDPIILDDILDLFLEFVQDEENSILVSSHITSDLEKVADYIVFIHQGKLIFSKPKDELTEKYGILKCGDAQKAAVAPEDQITCRRQDYEWQILVSDRQAAARKYPGAMVVPATIDEIMLLYIKGDSMSAGRD